LRPVFHAHGGPIPSLLVEVGEVQERPAGDKVGLDREKTAFLAGLSIGVINFVATKLEAELPAEAGPVLAKLCTNLVAAFGDPPAEWPWPDPILTYENPLVPRALIVAGVRGRRRPVVARGLAVLDWLIDVQASESGNFSPIGNRGWWPRGSERSGFDQQPIEAASMVLAAATAFGVTGRARYADAAETAYGWFLGDNDVGVPVAIPVSGGCFDGLTPSGPNSNQGAESTLMWLMSLEAIREMRRSRNIEISTGEALPAVSVTRARG